MQNPAYSAGGADMLEDLLVEIEEWVTDACINAETVVGVAAPKLGVRPMAAAGVRPEL